MKENQKRQTLVAVFAVIVVAAAIMWIAFLPTGNSKPAPNGPGIYYTGPMRSKGNRSVYGTEDGVRVPQPGSQGEQGGPGNATSSRPEAGKD